MYSISRQIGTSESSLLGQHLASRVVADIRLVCVLSAPSSICFVCISLCGSLSLSFCLAIWDSFNPTTLGGRSAVQCRALHLCATAFNSVHSI